jgi:hypothetical protein
MKSKTLLTANEKGKCPKYDGNCDVNLPCTSNCKRKHKKMSRRKRRQLDKIKIVGDREI